MHRLVENDIATSPHAFRSENKRHEPQAKDDIAMMNKMIRRVYVDTSAVGGAFAHRFAQDTKPFWDAVQREVKSS